MNDRLLQFIKYTAGRQSVFAEAMGWERTYVGKLVHGVGLGLTPVLAILEKYPDLNARWLLLGQGEMLRSQSSEARPEVAAARLHLTQQLALSRFFPVMTDDELRDYISGRTEFTPSTLARWSELLAAMFAPALCPAEQPKSGGACSNACPF